MLESDFALDRSQILECSEIMTVLIMQIYRSYDILLEFLGIDLRTVCFVGRS